MFLAGMVTELTMSQRCRRLEHSEAESRGLMGHGIPTKYGLRLKTKEPAQNKGEPKPHEISVCTKHSSSECWRGKSLARAVTNGDSTLEDFQRKCKSRSNILI